MIDKDILKFLDPRVLIPTIITEVATLIVGIAVMSVYIIIILSSIPMYLFRYVLSQSTKCLKPSLGKMVTARGQFLAIEQFTCPEKSPRSNIVATLILDGYVPYDELKQNLQRNLIDAVDVQTGQLIYPEATQFVTSYMGYKYWSPDPQFELENHVKVVKLGKHEENATVSWNELHDYIEILLNKHFHPTRSPWEIILVHNYNNPDLKSDAEKATVVLIRFHHCLADGYGALFTIVSAITTKTPHLPIATYASRGTLRFMLFKLTYPFRLVRDISRFIVLSLKDSPWKIRDDKKAWKQFYQNSELVPMARIKEIKNRFGVSFTSVLHSCLAAAMEKCLVSKYGVQKAKAHGATACVIMLPLPGHPRKFRNYCTGACLHLPTRQMDSVERLRQCEIDTVSVKKSTVPVLGQFLPIIGGSMFSKMAGIIGKNRSFPVSLSNFPFGDTIYDICGRNATRIYATAGSGAGVAGLGFLIYSYADGLQISVVGEQAIFSREDLDLIVETFAKEMDTLYNLATV